MRLAHSGRRRRAAINPYIVVADFAISLLMVIIVYFLVTARIDEAVYAADEQTFTQVASRVPHLSEKYRKILHNGPFLYFRFPNSALFSNATHISPSGIAAMRGMAVVLRDPNCATRFHDVRLTVSYPAEWGILNAQANADTLIRYLRAAGVTCPIVTSARSQRDPSVPNKQDLSSTEFAIVLKTSAHQP